jgi:hypothetical protein
MCVIRCTVVLGLAAVDRSLFLRVAVTTNVPAPPTHTRTLLPSSLPPTPCRTCMHHELPVCRWVFVCPTFDTCISTPHPFAASGICSKYVHHVPCPMYMYTLDLGRCNHHSSSPSKPAAPDLAPPPAVAMHAITASNRVRLVFFRRHLASRGKKTKTPYPDHQSRWSASPSPAVCFVGSTTWA